MAAGQVLPPISRAMLAAGLASIPNAAGLGFDSAEPSFVLSAPALALDSMAFIFSRIETVGVVPTAWLSTKVVMLPTSAGGALPISLLPMGFR